MPAANRRAPSVERPGHGADDQAVHDELDEEVAVAA